MITIFKKTLLCLLLASNIAVHAKTASGIVLEQSGGQPIAYVNIGVPGKDVGTVSNENGQYSISLEKVDVLDSLMFSCLGFEPFKIQVGEYLSKNIQNVKLNRRIINLREVVIVPLNSKLKFLGYQVKSSAIQAGFSDNDYGYECGVMMKNKKNAFLKTLYLDVAVCNYDTVFYRLNVYKPAGKNQFENILQQPVYINLTKEAIKKRTAIDLSKYNIVTDGDFLVTLEHVRNLGKGGLYFRCRFIAKTYYKKTSQGNWGSIPIGLGITVEAETY